MLELASSYKGSLLREKRGLWKSDGDRYLIEGTFVLFLKRALIKVKSKFKRKSRSLKYLRYLFTTWHRNDIFILIM